jgi:hypothetical protein
MARNDIALPAPAGGDLDVKERGAHSGALRQSFRRILAEHGIPYLQRLAAGEPCVERVYFEGGKRCRELVPAAPADVMRAVELLARYGVGQKPAEQRHRVDVRHVVVALPAVEDAQLLDTPAANIMGALAPGAAAAPPVLISAPPGQPPIAPGPQPPDAQLPAQAHGERAASG